MALIQCSKCGKQISDKAKKCPHCGTNNKISNNKKSNKKILFIVIFILLIVLVGSLFTYHLIKNNNNKDLNITNSKTAISDDLSGDGRAIEGKIQGMFHGMITTGWKNLPQGSNVDFGSGTETQGGWKLHLKSAKSFITTATGSFNWDLGTIDSSPYPIKGSR